MATYTIVYTGQCKGGAHHYYDLMLDGKTVKNIVLTDEEIKGAEVDLKDLALTIIKLSANTAKQTTVASAKTSIEAISVKI